MTQPPAPSNLTASYNASTQNVALNWTSNGSSVSDYAIDVSTNGGSTWTTQTAGLSPTTTSFTDTNAPDLATAEYRVRAIYGANSSAPSNTATVTTTVLKAPTGLAVAQSGASLVLTWTDATTTNSTVSIRRSTNGSSWTVLASVNHGVQTYTDSTVTEGGTYYYRIRNYDSAVPTYSAYDTAAAVTLPPAAPTHAEVVFSPLPTLQATVLWDNNSTHDTAYEVDRSTNGGGTWTTLTKTLPANSTSYTDTTVAGGQVYEYRVTALLNTLASTSATTLSETAAALPAPYYQGDIGDAGTVGTAGTASYNSSTGTYAISGAGVDIWNSADGFHYAYTTATGDADYVAEVDSMSNVPEYGKVGIMFRNTLDPSSMYADLFVNPAPQLWAAFEYRSTYAATPSSTGGYRTYTSLPIWLKLSRRGNVFTAYYGTNGTTWTQVGSATIAMGATVEIGMVTCDHNTAALGTGTFGNVALTNGPSVATSAFANPAMVSGTTTSLGVLGAGYRRRVDPHLHLGDNRHAAGRGRIHPQRHEQRQNTVATFGQAGSYQLQVTITDSNGLTATSSVTVTVGQTPTSFSITPTSATIALGGSQQFTAVTLDQFNQPLASQPAIAWTLASGPGLLTSGGLYTPPYASGSAAVRAASGGLTPRQTSRSRPRPNGVPERIVRGPQAATGQTPSPAPRSPHRASAGLQAIPFCSHRLAGRQLRSTERTRRSPASRSTMQRPATRCPRDRAAASRCKAPASPRFPSWRAATSSAHGSLCRQYNYLCGTEQHPDE